MNIKRAKEEIKDTIEAYLLKDENGEYVIPSIRQRPVLLIGPPGVGKTQIMEQISRECRIGLISYTITHHTRQSAVGLPFIEKIPDVGYNERKICGIRQAFSSGTFYFTELIFEIPQNRRQLWISKNYAQKDILLENMQIARWRQKSWKRCWRQVTMHRRLTISSRSAFL